MSTMQNNQELEHSAAHRDLLFKLSALQHSVQNTKSGIIDNKIAALDALNSIVEGPTADQMRTLLNEKIAALQTQSDDADRQLADIAAQKEKAVQEAHAVEAAKHAEEAAKLEAQSL